MTSDVHPTVLPSRELTTDAAKELTALHGLQQDLIFARECFSLIAEPPEIPHAELIVRAAWTSGLVAYVRCFSTGVRDRLSVDALAEVPGAAEVHDWLWKMRDKHIAHSVNAFEQVVPCAQINLATRTVDSVGVLSVQHVSVTREDAPQFVALCDAWLMHLQAKMTQAVDRAFAEAKALGFEALFAQPELELIIPHPDVVGDARPRAQ